MKHAFTLFIALAMPSATAWGQLANIPAKQTVQVSFTTIDHRVLITGNDLCPFVPIEFSGVWPDSVTKLTFRLLKTTIEIPYKQVQTDLSRLRSFNYGTGMTLTKADMTAWVTSSADLTALNNAKAAINTAENAVKMATEAVKKDTTKDKSLTTTKAQKEALIMAKQTLDTLKAKQKVKEDAFEDYEADVLLDNFYDFKEIIKDEQGGRNQPFTVLMLAPQLRRYYGVQVLAEGWEDKKASEPPRVLRFATEGVAGAGKPGATLAGGGLSILYAGDLDNLPHERFVPYSAVGVGFLDVDNHRAYPFLLTSVGLMISFRPIYSGVKNPFIHRYAQGGRFFGLALRQPANWVMNRLFFSGGITTASLTYRGRALATSAVKGTVGTGLFLLPGMGVSFDCSFGGVANYNPAFDPRTKPFFMLGASLRFTGQVTEIFRSTVGANMGPQFSK